MPGRLQFDISFRPEGAPRHQHHEGEPLRILVLADLSGRGAATAATTLIDRNLRPIDIDNFDNVMKTLSPGLGTDETSRIEFTEIDDFHPDQLYRRLRVFAALRDLRGRLLDPSTFDSAAAELLGDQDTDGGEKPPAAEGQPELFDRLLGAPTGSAPDSAGRGRSAIGALIADVVAPFVERDIADRQNQLVAVVDQSVGDLMSVVLHARPFQLLEARWRSLHTLVSNFDAEEDARVFLFDATRAELAADLSAAPLQETRLYRQLIDREKNAAGGAPWAMILVDDTFGAEAGELGVLAQLGGLASYSGGPLLAGADLALCGCRSIAATPDAHDWDTTDSELAQTWSALRAHPVAAHIGLAGPRLLARLPYGRRLEEVDAFDYEEFARGRDHEAYLWSNPAYAVARALVAEQLGQNALKIDDLPMHVYEKEGEREMQPCAEAWLSDRSAEAILEHGIMPLVSIRGRNAAALLRLQSIAEPARALT